MNQRQPAYRNEDLTVLAREYDCELNVAGVNCPTGPSVGCHMNMQAFGKGTGLKADDLVAPGCPGCHYEVDDGNNLTREEKQWYLMRGALRFQARLLREGRLVLTKPRRQK